MRFAPHFMSLRHLAACARTGNNAACEVQPM
jgi:hypothetical protein